MKKLIAPLAIIALMALILGGCKKKTDNYQPELPTDYYLNLEPEIGRAHV